MRGVAERLNIPFIRSYPSTRVSELALAITPITPTLANAFHEDLHQSTVLRSQHEVSQYYRGYCILPVPAAAHIYHALDTFETHTFFFPNYGHLLKRNQQRLSLCQGWQSGSK